MSGTGSRVNHKRAVVRTPKNRRYSMMTMPTKRQKLEVVSASESPPANMMDVDSMAMPLRMVRMESVKSRRASVRDETPRAAMMTMTMEQMMMAAEEPAMELVVVGTSACMWRKVRMRWMERRRLAIEFTENEVERSDPDDEVLELGADDEMTRRCDEEGADGGETEA
jgi:hypothetical protein